MDAATLQTQVHASEAAGSATDAKTEAAAAAAQRAGAVRASAKQHADTAAKNARRHADKALQHAADACYAAHQADLQSQNAGANWKVVAAGLAAKADQDAMTANSYGMRADSAALEAQSIANTA